MHRVTICITLRRRTSQSYFDLSGLNGASTRGKMLPEQVRAKGFSPCIRTLFFYGHRQVSFSMRRRGRAWLLGSVMAAFGAALSLFQAGLFAQTDLTVPAATRQTDASQTSNAPESAVNPDVIQQAIERLRHEAEPAPTQTFESMSTSSNLVAAPNPEAIESRL